MAARVRNFVNNLKTLNNIFVKSRCNLLRPAMAFEENNNGYLCSRCLCTHGVTSSRYSGVKKGLDKPQKRKILRKIKTEVYAKNMADPEMEKAARARKLLIPLEDVRKDWIPKKYPHQVMTMASYYGIDKHMFSGRKFLPAVVMDVNYGDNTWVHYGNFIEPLKTSCEPKVTLIGAKDSLTTLLMINLDGNIFFKDHELLHWMVGNIPNGDIQGGQVCSRYIPPCPVKGTGFHRFVFCLLKQKYPCDFQEICKKHSLRTLKSRTFKTSDFFEAFRDQLEPIGLSFFQATWDSSVSNTFSEILGKPQFFRTFTEKGTPEPVYDLEPFLTPNRKKKLQVRDVFAKKYTNM